MFRLVEHAKLNIPFFLKSPATGNGIFQLEGEFPQKNDVVFPYSNYT